MCICIEDFSLRVSSAIATPPLLHTELSLPPAAGDSTDQILADLHFARFRTREVTCYDHKNGPRLCEATVLGYASTFEDEENNDTIFNQRGGRKED